MRSPLFPTIRRPVRHRESAGRPTRIVLMESISERERPLRHRKEQVTVLRTIVRRVIWVAVLLTMVGVLVWRMTVR